MLIVLHYVETVDIEHIAKKIGYAVNGLTVGKMDVLKIVNDRSHIRLEFACPFHRYDRTKSERYNNSLNDVIDLYNTRKLKHTVICGTFGKAFIEDITTELGHDNVAVYSIIRNPSVAYLYDTSFLTATIDHDMGKSLMASVLNAVHLAKIPYVKTIRYEDVLVNQSIEVIGHQVNIELPSSNGIITDAEAAQPVIKQDTIDEFNFVYVDLRASNDNIPPFMDNDLFTPLGYTPMSVESIIKQAI